MPFIDSITPLPSNPNFINLNNQRFTRLRVLHYAGRDGSNAAIWSCECECGIKITTRGSHLRKGVTKSCGCITKEVAQATFRTHGLSYSPEYHIYRAAKNRCQNPNDKAYYKYGGRGIEFRFESFEEFFAEVGKRPEPHLSLDRRNNERHYEKGNLRWLDRSGQSRNTRTNRHITIDGVTKLLCEWSEISGTNVTTIITRIRRGGWCEKCAVFPQGRRCHKFT